MDKSKFTKGPWFAHLGETYRVHDKSNQTVAWATFVFSTETQTGRRSTDTVAANTHLIAAAPELYEALSDCLEYIAKAGEVGIVAKAYVALAKARGEAP